MTVTGLEGPSGDNWLGSAGSSQLGSPLAPGVCPPGESCLFGVLSAGEGAAGRREAPFLEL